jgi:hypothetical protein
MESTGQRAAFTSDRYTSKAFLQREKKLVFQKTWLVAVGESAVRRPGDCLAINEMDDSFFLVRGADAGDRAFRAWESTAFRKWLDRFGVPADLSFTAGQSVRFQKYVVFPNTHLTRSRLLQSGDKGRGIPQ